MEGAGGLVGGSGEDDEGGAKFVRPSPTWPVGFLFGLCAETGHAAGQPFDSLQY